MGGSLVEDKAATYAITAELGASVSHLSYLDAL